MKLKLFIMYSYFNITQSFSEKFGLSKELFNVNLKGEKVIDEYSDYEEYEIHPLDNNYFCGYQFKQNALENWQGVSFHINPDNNTEILNLLGEEFSSIDGRIIDLDEANEMLESDFEYEFCYFDKEHLLINGFISREESYISISKEIVPTQNQMSSSLELSDELAA